MKYLSFAMAAIMVLLYVGMIEHGMAQSPVPPGAQVEKITSGFQFTEGPVWVPDGFLLFSDIPANTIYKWDPKTGESSQFYKPSGNSNGLALDPAGLVLMCQHGNRRVARRNADGSETALASLFDGKKLNSPNDLAVSRDGSIYFTDPPYGISSGQQELGYSGIFRLAPDGQLDLLDKSLSYPNGICFSPDAKKLYVNDSPSRKIYVWDLKDDFTIENKTVFFSMTGSGNGDGMKIDVNGNLYSTGPGGVWIITPAGQLLDKISVPETTTNLNWGDADFKTLFITAGKSVYRIKLNVPGTSVKDQNQPPEQFQLNQNYPNPFNSSTTLTFSIPFSGHVKIDVLNVQGQIIDRVVDNFFSAGAHAAIWETDRSSLSSGIHLYRMTFSDQQIIRKMSLIR